MKSDMLTYIGIACVVGILLVCYMMLLNSIHSAGGGPWCIQSRTNIWENVPTFHEFAGGISFEQDGMTYVLRENYAYRKGPCYAQSTTP